MASVNLLDENLLLWNKFRSGSADAFGELMRTHYSDLFSYGVRFTRDTPLVMDCIQDLFLTLWMNRTTISETSFIKYYLLKNLRQILSRAISQSRRRTEPAFDYGFGSTSPGKMRKVLAGLSSRQQEILYLRFFMDADTDDIAEIISVNRLSVQRLTEDTFRRLRKISPKKVFLLNALRRV